MGAASRPPSTSLVWGAVVALALGGCGPSNAPRGEEQTMATIQEVKDAHTAAWMALPGVTGVGIGLCDGAECIRVFLAGPSPEAEEAIPDTVGGYPVDLEVTGPARARTSRDTGG